MSALNTFLQDRRGGLAIEYALILPLIFALVLGVVDVSRMLLAQAMLDHLSVELTDYFQLELSSESRSTISQAEIEVALQAIATEQLGMLVTDENLFLTVSVYEDMADYAGNVTGSSSSLMGKAGQIVEVKLDYTLSLITPFANFLYPDKALSLSAATVSSHV